MMHFHTNWHMVLTSVHHAAHVLAMHPAQFAASAALVAGMGVGGLMYRDFQPPAKATTTQQQIMKAPASAPFHNGAFGPMGFVGPASK